MNSLFRIAQLIRLIILQGKFRHSGTCFENARRNALKELSEFCGSPRKEQVFKNLIVQYWLGQAAFIRNAFMSRGGHLSVPLLHLNYIRNPKAASTALSYAMLSAYYPELRNRAITPDNINFLADVNLQQKLGDADHGDVFFTVVRNPFARIVSVYRQFFEGKERDFIYGDYLFGILRRDQSFKDFVTMLRMIPDRLKDQHLRPQHSFLRFYERQGIQVRVIRLEDDQVVREFLSGYRLIFKPLNKSDVYDYRTYYDSDTVELVNRLYEGDIWRFGYEGVVRELRGMRGGQTDA